MRVLLLLIFILMMIMVFACRAADAMEKVVGKLSKNEKL